MNNQLKIIDDNYFIEIPNGKINKKSRLKVTHKKCSYYWEPTIYSFYTAGKSCPKCMASKRNMSKGEKQLSVLFNKYHINYETDKAFDTLIWRDKQKCDFYLPDDNIIIEYNGKQHYSVKSFGQSIGEATIDFIDQIGRDANKRFWAECNGINFIEIPYTLKTDEQIIRFLRFKGLNI